jgi:hypothetical protein
MNATEHLVEIYFRHKDCFTISDVKVINGNNRQFDLLAVNLIEKKSYHIEVSITHGQHWQYSLEGLKDVMQYKFFGDIKSQSRSKKNQLESITKTYEKFGIDFKEVIRVWCCWCLPENPIEEIDNWKHDLASIHNLDSDKFKLISLRDEILPQLFDGIKTANYADEILRTLSLVKEQSRQTKNKSL